MPVFRLSKDPVFPDPSWATSEGLLAIEGDLSPQRLVSAYKRGIFPWYGEGEPIMWWSPDPRCVLFPAEVYVSKRLQRVIKQKQFQLTCNRDFPSVVTACADVRVRNGEETWLIDEMKSAYQRLHELGYAHSIEAWSEDRLVGGLYGVALGRFFFGESMFHLESNASKVVLAQLCRYMEKAGFVLLDCQVPNPHLDSMGARHIPRNDFLAMLAKGGLGPDGAEEKVVLPGTL